MYIYGAGGHAKVVLDILRATGRTVAGFIDDDDALTRLLGLPVRHTAKGCTPIIIGIGDNATRARLAARLTCTFATAVHPSAVLSPSARIGDGTVVMAGAVLNAEAAVGRHCIVNTGASVDHECRLSDFVHLSPHATLCGRVCVGQGAWIGAGATVVPGVSIGRWARIGAGATVLTDIPDGATAVGTPATIIKLNSNMHTLNNLMGGGAKSLTLPYAA